MPTGPWPAQPSPPLSSRAFDTGLVDRHFRALESRPPWLREPVLANLAPVCRSMLVADGTLTPMLEAHSLEPVEVSGVRVGRLDGADPRRRWLDRPEGGMTRRALVIVGRLSTVTYVTAESILLDAALPDRFHDEVRRSRRGLGAALADAGAEVRRELLWYGQCQLGPAGGQGLARAYRIFMDRRAVILVEEVFHLAAF
jgi:chorismate-pyruvate lyase